MGPDQRHAEEVDLVEQFFESLVGVKPLAYLGQEVLGDIGGTGTAAVLEGELVGTVFGAAVVAVTGSLATASPDCTE